MPGRPNLAGSNPYALTTLDTWTVTNPSRNGTGEAFELAARSVTFFNPLDPIYPGTSIGIERIEAFLVKVKVKSTLGRQTGNIEVQFRRNSSESWTTLFAVQAGGSAGNWPVSEASTEIIYHDKAAGKAEWRIVDAATSPAPASPVVYDVILDILGIYFN
jgi:hypothetical protein